MPNIAPICKVKAVESYGAEITFVEPEDEVMDRTLIDLSEKLGAKIVHPTEERWVMAGQGSIAVELLDQLEDKNIDAVLIPVGGGGMISGMAVHIKSIRPDIKIIAVEPKLGDDCYISKKSGKLTPNASYSKTIADGVRVSIGPNTWPIIRDLVDDVYLLSEQEIVQGWQMGMERLKVVLEPTAGLGLAAANSEKFYEYVQTKFGSKIENIAVVLCGGNVDLGKVSEIVEAHL